MKDQLKIWDKYIRAQSRILIYKSRPIRIDIEQSNPVKFEGNKLKLYVDQDFYKQIFKAEVDKIFKIDFNFKNSYILVDAQNAAEINPTDLINLKELSEQCYVDFNDSPVVEGVIWAKNSEGVEKISEVVGELSNDYNFTNFGVLHLTIDQWRNLQMTKSLRFEEKIGAIFPIMPSVSFLISSFYKKIDIEQKGLKITTKGEIHEKVYNLFHKHFGLRKNGNSIHFVFKNNIELKRKKVDLPEQIENTLSFTFHNDFYEAHDTNLSIEAYRLKASMKRYFPNEDFEYYYTTHYSYDPMQYENGLDSFEDHLDTFWNRVFEIHGNGYSISRSNCSISFDFSSEEELNEKLNQIKSFYFFDVYDRGENQKFKFKIKFESGLHNLQKILKANIPSLFTKLVYNGERLIFRHYYEFGNKTEVQSRLINQLNAIIDSSKFSFEINNSFQEKYLCEENFEYKAQQEEEKLSKLLKEEFYFGDFDNKSYLGKLIKVNYPELIFSIDDSQLHSVKNRTSQQDIVSIFPDLKGEKDKIKRLEDTMGLLGSNKTLANNNAKQFLFDASYAKKIENINYLISETSAEWLDFEGNIFSSTLNLSQKQAIFKSLHAKEFALIQGPPGCGKSSAIAEIIWQHVRTKQKQKILITSETNLAVDNAIDRLKNNHNNIVKPIRFGKDENLESEGYFYSISAINEWKGGFSKTANAVSHWIGNIVNRIQSQNNENIDAALEKWKKHLKQPDKETRKLFAEKYIDNANLIGATGSSIGVLNSENKWTSFFRSYLSVFNRANFENNNFRALKDVKISFDVVLMDEASKATPPELALPVVYGKKSIIVGDHRQLPPMIDGEEIKDVLMSIGEKGLADALSQKDFEISHFQRLFEKIDSSIKGTFDTQYRMHPAINEVIAQFYKEDGGLKCGLPLDESYHNSFDKWDSRYHGLSYKNILTPEIHTIWIDVKTPEIQDGTSRVNFGEIEAIDNILKIIRNADGKEDFDNWLANKSLEEKQIGLISFYGKQIFYLNKMLKEKHNDLPFRLSTVDRFQGMERNIIIVSMVRSNKIAAYPGQEQDFEKYIEYGYPKQESLGFAESPNRLNVALSRARRLLIIVGNSNHFCRKEIYENVYNEIQKNGKIISLEELREAAAKIEKKN
jgi:superfamily I DNA and/or RNA helicase